MGLAQLTLLSFSWFLLLDYVSLIFSLHDCVIVVFCVNHVLAYYEFGENEFLVCLLHTEAMCQYWCAQVEPFLVLRAKSRINANLLRLFNALKPSVWQFRRLYGPYLGGS